MKKLFKLLAVLLLNFILFNSSQAQFSKYKSKTKFKASNTPSTSLGRKDTDPNDIFGRDSGINTVKGIKKDKRYVNLNPETAFGPEVVTSFDFPSTSLIDLTKHMQKLTGINLILDKDLKGKISIMAPSPITVGDAWKAYLTALNLNGYTMVKSGSFYKIVNARDIRYTPTKIYTGNYTPDTENYVMRILPLRNINSTEVTRSFRPFMSRYGRIIDIKQTNTIIVQDTGANINRLVRLIKFIDVPGHEETLQIIQVKNSSAQEIAKLLDKILKGKTKKPGSMSKRSQGISKIIAEPRTNSIIAMANAEGAKQLRNLIRKLDVKIVASSSGQIHVYYLNHGDAETLAKTLSALVSSAKKSGGRFSGKGSPAPTIFTAEVKITSDKSNNALVVTASPTDYLTIKNVIKKLDIARDQVYVEGMIMETTVNRTTGLGISIIGAYGTGSAARAGFTGGSNDLISLLTGNITSLGGLFAGFGIGRKIITTTPDGKEIEVNTVNGLITAVAANSDTNVLATPQILVLDNSEATFEVGETVPIAEKTNAANGSSTTSIKQQKVALTLKITPQINKATRFIKLKIDQKVEDFSQRALETGGGGGVSTTTRSAITTVVVRDKDTIAMGGLMRDKEVITINKVPLLGDIPVLGWLFKNKNKNVTKVNLLFFLTPKILSPYEKNVSAKIKDVLNRRAAHLKNVIGEEDAFGSTVKGMYEKAKRQGEGPLFDPEDVEKYRDQNDELGVIKMKNGLRVKGIPGGQPNYQMILQKVGERKSSTKSVKVKKLK